MGSASGPLLLWWQIRLLYTEYANNILILEDKTGAHVPMIFYGDRLSSNLIQ